MMDSQAVRPGRIEGYAIVSEDGMLADATGVMPDSLKFDADQKFFERGLDRLDVVVHGRHSRERHLRSQLRRRLVVTRRVFAIAADPSEANSLFWNPAGASFEEALTSLGTPNASVGKRRLLVVCEVATTIVAVAGWISSRSALSMRSS
jgi:hypothetical protein